MNSVSSFLIKNLLIISMSSVSFAHTPSGGGSCKSLLGGSKRLQRVLTADETHVIKTLESAILSPENLTDRAQVLIKNIEQRVNTPGQKLSAVDHAALSHIYLTKVLEPLGLQSEIEKVLILLTESITKSKVNKDNLGKRLPRKFLKNIKPDALTFYNASFRDPKNRNPDKFTDLIKNYIPLKRDYAVFFLSSLSITASAFYNLGADYIAASFMGLFITGLAEHMFHGYGAHASNKLKDLPIVGKTFKKMEFNHAVVHHGVTFKSYIQQFESKDHQNRVDKLIDKQIERSEFQENYKSNLIDDSDYGIILSKKDYLLLALPIFTITALSSYFLGFDLTTTALVSGPTLLYPAGVNFTHKYMHMSKDEVLSSSKDRLLLKAFLKSRYVMLMAQIHYVHHERYNTNYNLLYLFSDVLLGKMKLPSLRELAEIRQNDGLGTTWGSDSLD